MVMSLFEFLLIIAAIVSIIYPTSKCERSREKAFRVALVC